MFLDAPTIFFAVTLTGISFNSALSDITSERSQNLIQRFSGPLLAQFNEGSSAGGLTFNLFTLVIFIFRQVSNVQLILTCFCKDISKRSLTYRVKFHRVFYISCFV